jgi:hypothetical protein
MSCSFWVAVAHEPISPVAIGDTGRPSRPPPRPPLLCRHSAGNRVSRDSLPERGACPEGCPAPRPRRHRTDFGDPGVRTPLRADRPAGLGGSSAASRARIARIASGASTAAINRSRPPQRGPASTSWRGPGFDVAPRNKGLRPPAARRRSPARQPAWVAGTLRWTRLTAAEESAPPRFSSGAGSSKSSRCVPSAHRAVQRQHNAVVVELPEPPALAAAGRSRSQHSCSRLDARDPLPAPGRWRADRNRPDARAAASSKAPNGCWNRLSGVNGRATLKGLARSRWPPRRLSGERPVQSGRRACGGIHGQAKPEDHVEEDAGHRLGDDSAAAVRPRAERHRTCSARAGEPRSTLERACFTTCRESTPTCAAREVTIYLAVASPLPPVSPLASLC